MLFSEKERQYSDDSEEEEESQFATELLLDKLVGNYGQGGRENNQE